MPNKTIRRAAPALLLLACVSCATHNKHTGVSGTARYELTSVSRSRILVDNRYDARPVSEATAFIKPYAAKVDSLMSPVVGRAAHYMAKGRPEGELSNLLPDILMWASPKFGENPDFAVYNYGGIRAAIAAGDVTAGDVLDVAPFENKICFVTLTGAKVLELFAQMAGHGGECVSHGVRLVINRSGRLVSAGIGGRPVSPDATYRVVTLDFVAQGNDDMVAFKDKTDVNSPQDEKNNVRYIIMDYFRDKAAKGEAVSSKIEGRTTLVE